jgi:hypothetical protein
MTPAWPTPHARMARGARMARRAVHMLRANVAPRATSHQDGAACLHTTCQPSGLVACCICTSSQLAAAWLMATRLPARDAARNLHTASARTHALPSCTLHTNMSTCQDSTCMTFTCCTPPHGMSTAWAMHAARARPHSPRLAWPRCTRAVSRCTLLSTPGQLPSLAHHSFSSPSGLAPRVIRK